MKTSIFLLFSLLCLAAVLTFGRAHAALTLEQVVTGANVSRSDIRTGELLYTEAGYNAPTYTLAEAQKWLTEQKAMVRKEIEEEAKRGDSHLADKETQDDYYKSEIKMYTEIFQLNIDEQSYAMTNRAAFERYREIKSFRDAFRHVRYHSVDVDRQPRDPSKPYTIADYTLTVFNGKKQSVAHANRRYAGGEEAEVWSTDEPGGSDYLHLWGHGLFPIPNKKAKLLGQESVDNVGCYVVQFEGVHIPFANGRTPIQTKYWIAPEYGFRTVAEEYALRKDDSQPTLYVTAKNRDFREYEGIWYPTSREVIEYFLEGSRKGEIQTKTDFNVKHATFNISFPKDLFKISAAPQQPDRDNETERAYLECGPRSLLIACQIIGIDANFDELVGSSDFSEESGTTMAGLYQAATLKGLNPAGVRTTLDDLYRLDMPVIAHVNEGHFLVVTEADPRHIRIRDPIQQYDSLSPEEFERIWNGALLIFTVDREDVAPISVDSSSQPPPLHARERRHHFAEAIAGQELKHTFTITNTGGDPVLITDIRNTCYCTTAILTDKNIAPGKNVQIEVTLNVPSRNETIKERVRIHTDSPAQPTLEFSITANARLPLAAIPEHIVLGSFSPEAFKPKTFILRQVLDPPVQIRSVTTDSEHFGVEYETDPATGNVRGEIHLEPGMPIGEFTHLLRVEFGRNGNTAAMTMSIIGKVLGDFNVFPRQLFFGITRPGDTNRKSLTVTRLRGDPLEIKGVKVASKHIETELIALNAGTRYKINVSLNATEAPDGDFSDTLIVETNSSNQPRIEVPVYAKVHTKSAK